MTYEIHVERLTPTTLHFACNTEQVPPEMISALMEWPRSACAVFPDTVLNAWSVIVAWLPGTSSAALERLASHEPIVMNFHSTDLMTYRTMLCWRDDHAPEVRLDMWRIDQRYLAARVKLLVASVMQPMAVDSLRAKPL